MPFETLQFRYSWRPYQQRVLDAIDDHLDDYRLHIVAAPGAGKTTLGLEVFKRLGKSTLMLSPTRVNLKFNILTLISVADSLTTIK
jgi:superfamily II DNA or RNA helicase